MLIGLIADTHGLVRPEIAGVFRGVELILHAGDVGSRDVLVELGLIAPVEAVCGNLDPIDLMLQPILVKAVGNRIIHISHGHQLSSPTPERLAARYHADIVVFGHTHKAVVRRIGGTLVVNPGSAGPRRFNLEPSVAILKLDDSGASVKIVPLAPA